MSCPHCFSGSVHDNQIPAGREAVTHGRKTYVAEPPSDTECKGIIVIVPDAFGWMFVNNRILADNYAKKGGFRVLLPDFMDGHSAPLWMIDTFPKLMDTASLWAWISKPYHIGSTMYGFVPFVIRNRLSVSLPKVQSFLSAVRKSEDANMPIGVAGFCWGGKHAFVLSASSMSTVDVAFTAHPSNLAFPTDIENIKGPISVAIGDKDFVMPLKQVKDMERILGKLKDVKSEVKVYPGAGHGFSVRADIKNEKQAQRADEAEDQAMRWFSERFAEVKK